MIENLDRLNTKNQASFEKWLETLTLLVQTNHNRQLGSLNLMDKLEDAYDCYLMVQEAYEDYVLPALH
jgi:hypothetical protein